MTDHERQPEARGEISGHRQLHEPAEPITDQLLQVKRTVARRSADTKGDAESGVHLERASARHSGNLLSIHGMTRASGWTQRAAELPSSRLARYYSPIKSYNPKWTGSIERRHASARSRGFGLPSS